MVEGGFSGDTKVLALIADPVASAKSPHLVNRLLAQRGLLGEFVLVPLATSQQALAPLVHGLRKVENFYGAIVSMPHKAAIVPLLDAVSEEVALTGAVNVVRRDRQGRLIGTCLDGEGMVAGLASRGHRVAGKSCLLLGAGGAASAIAVALARHGCASLTIQNRTQARADAVAASVRASFPNCVVRVEQSSHHPFDLVINATPVGMAPNDPAPLDLRRLCGVGLVAECVVAQESTTLLRQAQTLGYPIHPGLPMLEAQIELMATFMGVPSAGARSDSTRAV